MSELYLIGFAQSIFFMLLILTKKKVELKDLILSSYILILGLNLIFIYWDQTGFHQKNPVIILVDLAYWTLLGPLLYLYIELSAVKRQVFKWKHLVHLLPLIFILIAFSKYFSSDFEGTFFEYQENSILFYAGLIVWMYNSPIYYILSLIKLRSHKKRIKKYFATPKNVDLKWLNYLVHGFAIFLFFLLFKGFILRILNIDLNLNSYHLTWAVMVIYIFGIGFFGYKQKGIFSDFEAEDLEVKEIKISENEKTNFPKEQYLKSSLKDEEARRILTSLEKIMQAEKPYLEYDITLPKLAQLVGTTSHKLSQVINENYKLNFFEYINKFRLNDVKTLLKNPEKASEKIMALAYDCGFNSKSAFYNFFKRETKLTPSEYRSEHLHLVEA